jgi:16S rRNA (uracil1498-N3)-methyltransferase
MHRFFVPPSLCRGEIFDLPEGETHHALRVLRLERGAPIVVLDGAGQTIDAEIVETSRKAVTARVRARRSAAPPLCRVTLAQAIPKGKLMDAIVQKAAELGVARVIPVLSERVISQLDHDSAASKAEKWRQHALEAIKQCGTPWCPEISSPAPPRQVLDAADKPEISFIASLEPDSRPLGHHFRRFVQDRGRLPQTASVWIGPEGDFTKGETALVVASGAYPVTLGPLVLRCETAAIATLAILNHELQMAAETCR